jgi:hypothetical protein
VLFDESHVGDWVEASTKQIRNNIQGNESRRYIHAVSCSAVTHDRLECGFADVLHVLCLLSQLLRQGRFQLVIPRHSLHLPIDPRPRKIGDRLLKALVFTENVLTQGLERRCDVGLERFESWTN